MQSENFKRFVLTYIVELNRQYEADPEWLATLLRKQPTIPRLAVQMTRDLITARAKKDSEAIRRTCKALGVKHTYKAIKAYLT